MHKIIHPTIFAIEEAEREEIIKFKYQDYGWGAWSMIIHHWATSFIEKGSFPEYHPLAFFPNHQVEQIQQDSPKSKPQPIKVLYNAKY